MKNKAKKVIYLVLVLLWMAIVFKYSNQPADLSQITSLNITKKIAEIVTTEETTIEEKEQLIMDLDPVVRKAAHFCSYAIGGILIMLYLNTYEIDEIKKIKYSILIGAIYACTDEIHQLFVPGRSGEIPDVILDTIGVTVGVLISFHILKEIKKRNKIDENAENSSV